MMMGRMLITIARGTIDVAAIAPTRIGKEEARKQSGLFLCLVK